MAEAGFDYEAVTWGGGQVIAPDKADFLDHSLHLRYALDALRDVRGKVVEIGCGSGRFIASVGAARPDLEVHGSDVSKTALALAEQRPNLHVKVADALALPYPDGFFDAVLMIDVLEHLPDPKKALAEVRRVLRPNGVFHLVFPCEGHPWTLHGRVDAVHLLKREYAGHIQRLSPKELLAMLNEAGLQVGEVQSSYHFLGQLYDLAVFGAMKLGVNMHEKRQSLVETGDRNWVSYVRQGLSRLLYAEAKLMAKTSLGMTVHVSARSPI